MQPGTMLSHYRVAELIGKGGMGEVYRARDTKLDRDVALKILPSEFAADGDRLARFQREAKVLASLHHPNIASIFGFETTGAATFLVMELVEGEDLAALLRRGSLPVDEAVEIASQIAEGLEQAHEQGIIHRDLKPANVKLTTDGKVKVLDFGLARVYAGQTAVEGDVTSAPTMTAGMTQAGTVLGTAAYMSPEQARGKEMDRRTDIWSFGVILFEMLTGRQLFKGETASDTLAEILKAEPAWTALPEGLPPQVERVLRRCLAKDPRQRLRDIGEARVRLNDPTAESDLVSGPLAAMPEEGRRWARWLPWGLLAAAVAVAVVLGLRGAVPGDLADPIAYRFELRTPADGDLPEVSPDGRRFAYVAEFEGEDVVWVRSFAEPEGRPLRGTDPAHGFVFWSPDGYSLAYFTDETLETVSAEGGPPSTICTLPRGWSVGDWSASGSFLVEIEINPEDEGWYFCRPGGTVEKLVRPLAQESGQTRSWPTFLPDGEHIVFTHHVDGVKQAVLTRPGSTETTLLFPTDTRVLVAGDGWYVFSRKGRLLALAFDPRSFLPVGEPRVLAEEVALFEPNGWLAASVSDQGTVIHGTDAEDREVVWFDRDGRELDQVVDSGGYRGAELSPDGRRLLLIVNDPRTGTGDLWIRDLERGLSSRLTDTPWAEFAPVWSPDGREIVYSADPQGPPNIFVIDADGGEPRELVPMNQHVHYPSDWTPHGDIILFHRSDPDTRADLWTLDAAGGDPAPLLRTEYAELSARVSPDGRWLAYTSNATGRAEIYVQPFAGDGPRQRVSIDGGWSPSWDGDQRLFFLAPGEALMSVVLTDAGDRLGIARPERVLALEGRDLLGYDLHPDGRILVRLDAGPLGVLVSRVIVGWD